MLQRLGGSRAVRHGSDAPYSLFFESCSSSMACDMEEVCSESSMKMKKDETTSEAFVDRFDKRVRERGVDSGPEGEAEKLEAIGLGSVVKGVAVNPEGESRHRHALAKMAKKER